MIIALRQTFRQLSLAILLAVSSSAVSLGAFLALFEAPAPVVVETQRSRALSINGPSPLLALGLKDGDELVSVLQDGETALRLSVFRDGQLLHVRADGVDPALASHLLRTSTNP